MPKKQRNGFYFFMCDQIEYYRKQGQQYNMMTIAPIANPKWQELLPAEREYYNNRAKVWKQHHKMDDKMDSKGQLIKEVLADELDQQQKVNERNLYVRELIGSMDSMEAVAKKKFYFINFNIFCKTLEREVIPAEIGVVEYCIQDGITKTFHEFIHPGSIPTGYGFTAKQHSEETHKIPPTDFDRACVNYMYIYEELKKFVNPRNPRESFAVFCMEDEIEQTEGALAWLRKKSLDKNQNKFQVYDLARLLLEYCRYAKNAEGFTFVDSPALMRDWLTKTTFEHAPNISCQWHETQDASNQCSLGIVKCFSYLISERICPMHKITPKANCHLPLHTDSAAAAQFLDWSQLKIRSKSSDDVAYKDLCAKKAYVNSGRSMEETQTIVKNHKSKFSDVADKVCIPGQAPGVLTEIPIKAPTVTVASFLRKTAEFEMNDEDFPPVSSGFSLGRGSGSTSRNKQSSQLQGAVGSAPQRPNLGRGSNKYSGFKNLLE